MTIRQWIEHKTNPLHMLNRIVDLWLWYDKIWVWLFDREGYRNRIKLMHELMKIKKEKERKYRNV